MNETRIRILCVGVPCLALLIAAALSHGGAAVAKETPPNIIIFMADDLGWKDVGYHGSEIKTPNLDRLAAAGVRLERFYVQPVCSPTRASLMTGRYPIRQGLQVAVIWPWATWGLPLEERTLPSALKDAGYTTAITGKWHLGAHAKEYLPRQRGFDHQYGHYLGAIDYFTHSRNGGLDWHRNGKALREEGYTTNLIGAEAAGIIDHHTKDKPLFLYVPFNAPHAPLQAPDEYIARYKEIEDVKRRKFAAMVTCMDDAIGKVVAALDRQGMRENTLILFSSDNGGPTRLGANNGSLRGGKGTLYEGGVRVPALAVWPGKLRPGTVEETMHIVDWYPTLLRIAGGTTRGGKPLDGVDVWPAIAEGKPSPRDEILHNHEPSRAAVRKGEWKLIVHEAAKGAKKKKAKDRSEGRTVELFNVVADPDEKTNLAAEHPEHVTRLTKLIEGYAKAAIPPKGVPGGQPKGFKTPKVWGEF